MSDACIRLGPWGFLPTLAHGGNVLELPYAAPEFLWHLLSDRFILASSMLE